MYNALRHDIQRTPERTTDKECGAISFLASSTTAAIFHLSPHLSLPMSAYLDRYACFSDRNSLHCERVTDSAAAVARQDILLASGHIDVPAAAAATVSCGQKERLDKSGRATTAQSESEASFSIFHLESSSFHLRCVKNVTSSVGNFSLGMILEKILFLCRAQQIDRRRKNFCSS